MITTLVLALVTSGRPAAADPAGLAEDLADARLPRRYDAVFRAFQMESTALFAGALLKASDDPDLRVRLWAVAALGKSGDPRVFFKLVEWFDDPELFVRYRAAEGLKFLQDPKTTSPL